MLGDGQDAWLEHLACLHWPVGGMELGAVGLGGGRPGTKLGAMGLRGEWEKELFGVTVAAT